MYRHKYCKYCTNPNNVLPRAIVVVLLLASLAFAGAVTHAQSTDDSVTEAMHYSTAEAADPIAKLQRQIDAGTVTLNFNGPQGYLASLMKALKVPLASQMLVFSKTSFQRELISPRHPRALYFNDSTYLGWVDGGPVVEVTAIDPQLGSVFYLLPQIPTAKPHFVRQKDDCLECHSSSITHGIPGNIMRSVYPDVSGMPLFEAGTYVTTDQSPLTERWGGWYVTGNHGKQRHLGNMIFRNASETVQPNTDQGANIVKLSRFIEPDRYLTSTSDIVALLVAEHQTHVQNLITGANWGTRSALDFEKLINKDLGRGEGFRSDSTLSRIKSVCEPLVKALLFSQESPLIAPIKGTSGYAGWFMCQGPKDRSGRSLRQFDLTTRLFKYPCSYLIYSSQFDALPPIAHDYIYRRISEVLAGKDTSPEFVHLSPTDRQNIEDILLETKPDYAAFVAKKS